MSRPKSRLEELLTPTPPPPDTARTRDLQNLRAAIRRAETAVDKPTAHLQPYHPKEVPKSRAMMFLRHEDHLDQQKVEESLTKLRFPFQHSGGPFLAPHRPEVTIKTPNARHRPPPKAAHSRTPVPPSSTKTPGPSVGGQAPATDGDEDNAVSADRSAVEVYQRLSKELAELEEGVSESRRALIAEIDAHLTDTWDPKLFSSPVKTFADLVNVIRFKNPIAPEMRPGHTPNRLSPAMRR